jgi:hypothetical protein
MTHLSVKDIEELSLKKRKNLAIDLITGNNQNDSKECVETAWIFFLKTLNSVDAFSILKPKEYKRNIKTYKNKKDIQETQRKINYNKRKKLNDNTIDKCYKVWTRTDLISSYDEVRKRKRASKRPLRIFKKYMFNLESFYYYCKKGWKTNFTETEKAILEFLFLPEPVRLNLYDEYYSINFLDALLKYYARFYIHYLENPPKKLNHYFDKDFLDYIIFSNPLNIKDNKKPYLYDEKGNRLFKVVKSSKESKIWDKYNIKFKQYWSPTPEAIITQIGKGNRKISLGEWTPKKKYYSVYESLHIFYPEIIKELDHKILNILLKGFAKKNN